MYIYIFFLFSREKSTIYIYKYTFFFFGPEINIFQGIFAWNKEFSLFFFREKSLQP